MKIVIVNRGMGVFRGGGEIYDLRLTEHLAAMGLTVTYIAGRALRGAPKTPEPPVETAYVRTPYLRAFAQSLPAYIRPAVTEADLLMFERQAFQAIRRSGAGVVQMNGMPVLAAFVTGRLGVPTVLVLHGRPRGIFAPFIRRATAVVSYGDTLRWLRTIRPDTEDIPPGVDGGPARPAGPGQALAPRGGEGAREVRRELGVPPGAFVVLFVGRLVPIKNLPLLVEGFARAARHESALRLLICGEGQLRASLDRRVRALGLGGRVHWAGYIPHHELGPYYDAADVFAIASAHDNFPVVVLEAMAAGLPVVGTRVGGIPLQIEEPLTGLLVRPGDADDLARALLMLARDRALARRMGDAGRERVQNRFSWTASAERLRAVYDRVTGTVM